MLDDLHVRLERTRWTNEADDSWTLGTSLAELLSLVDYWKSHFDWRREEDAMNRFAHFRANVNGFGVHFIHERGTGNHSLPIILTHGYPDSFLRFAKIIPMLAHPDAYGGDPSDAFDVVVPLGYTRYAAHGGDWGGLVTEQLARSHAQSVVGIHLTDVPFWHMFRKPKDVTHAEQRFLDNIATWQTSGGAYALIQGTRPYTLASALNDSPAGLASWIVDKFHAWSDCHGDVETKFTKDELLANITLYWLTNTAASSGRLYWENKGKNALSSAAWKTNEITLPVATTVFGEDAYRPPESWARRAFPKLIYYNKVSKGGHFAAWEQPELFASELRAAFRSLR